MDNVSDNRGCVPVVLYFFICSFAKMGPFIQQFHIKSIPFFTDNVEGRIFLAEFSKSMKLKKTDDWYMYSVHLDTHKFWTGKIRYVQIEFDLPTYSNISIDSIRLTWMPYCVRNWSFLGPFFSGTQEELLDRDFIQNEDTVTPFLGDVLSGRKWGDIQVERDLIDLRYFMGNIDFAAGSLPQS